MADCKIELLPDYASLVAAEREAILVERPKHNIVHNGVVVGFEDEAGWREPWLEISPRVTAGANHLHEECRQRYAANYPEEGYRATAPCGLCFRRSLELLEAVDSEVGHKDESVGLAGDAFRHLNWVEAQERNSNRSSEVRLVSLPAACGCRPCLKMRGVSA